MRIVNRQGFRVHYGKAFTHWIQSLPDLPNGFELSAETLNRHPTVYLMDLQADDQAVEVFLQNNQRQLFEALLHEWVSEPELWPSPIPLANFADWFQLEVFDMVKDISLEPLESEVFEND